MTETVAALFDSYSEALAAVEELETLRISRSDISILSSDPAARHGVRQSNAGEDAGIGAGVGAIVGGAGGLAAGLGLLAIPGIGPVVAAGWLIATAAGVGAGAVVGGVTGGIVGSLTSAGIPEREANVYAEGLRRGGTIVTARVPKDRVITALDVLDRHRQVDLRLRGADYERTGWRRFDDRAPPYTPEEIAADRARYRPEVDRERYRL